jgi:NAD+ synthase (glutamine-hydrolysing)
MKLVKIGVASTSIRVGDFSGNKSLLIDVLKEARKAGVHLLVTPELAISGYRLESLGSAKSIGRQSWASLAEIAGECDQITAVIGLPVFFHGKLVSAAAVVSDKIICGIVLKDTPPSTLSKREPHFSLNGVSAGKLCFNFPWGRLIPAFSDTLSALSCHLGNEQSRATVVCPMEATPFTVGSIEKRRVAMMDMAARFNCICAHANLLGSEEGHLIFDGGGMISAPDGIVKETPLFSKQNRSLATALVDLGEEEGLCAPVGSPLCTHESQDFPGALHSLSCPQPVFKPASLRAFINQEESRETLPPASKDDDPLRADYEAILDALALGLRDYFCKAGAFKKILLALSGGQDSALCLLVALRAIRMLTDQKQGDDAAAFIQVAYLPNRKLSSTAGKEAAQALAEECGIPFRIVTIHEEVDVAFAKAVELMEEKKKVLPLTRQNLQARVRGAMMLNWSNNVDGLLLVTSNMSEIAVGYSTMGGDNEGGYSPLANVPKTLVTRLLGYLAEQEKLPAIHKVLALAPSAELAPDQTDEEDLMPYPVLDEILKLYVGKGHSLVQCWRMVTLRFPEYDAQRLREWVALFARRFANSQWKRNQHPVSPKVLDYDLHALHSFRLPLLYQMQSELDELENATR